MIQERLSFSLVNLEIVWEEFCEFDELTANNFAHEFLGMGE